MSAELTVHGLDELLEDLKRLPNAVRVRVAQNAVNAGARVIRDEAKQRIPVRTGRTRNQIRTFARRSVESIHEVIAAVGVRGRGKGARTHIARFLEFGTGRHLITPRDDDGAVVPGSGHPVKRVQHPGSPPRPFLRPAFDAKRQEALNAMIRVLRAGILRNFRKLGMGVPSFDDRGGE